MRSYRLLETLSDESRRGTRYGFVSVFFLAVAYATASLGLPGASLFGLLALLLPLGMMTRDGQLPTLLPGALLGAALGTTMAALLLWSTGSPVDPLFAAGLGCLFGAPTGALFWGLRGETQNRPPDPESADHVTKVKAAAVFLLLTCGWQVWSWDHQSRLQKTYRGLVVSAEQLARLDDGRECVILGQISRKTPPLEFDLAAYDLYEEVPGKLDSPSHEEFRGAKHPRLEVETTSNQAVVVSEPYKLHLGSWRGNPPLKFYGIGRGENVTVHGWVQRLASEPAGLVVTRATLHPGGFLDDVPSHLMWLILVLGVTLGGLGLAHPELILKPFSGGKS